MTKSIAYFTPDHDDACSFYRGIGPLCRLPSYSIRRLPNQISWSVLMGADVGFMQRPFHDKHVTIAGLMKDQFPLWIDYDDDLFNVPPDNPAYQTYINPKIKENIEQLCQMADVITVTTPALAEIYSPLNPNCTVIPNAYNDYLLPLDLPSEPQDKIVLWRGSNAHQKDLLDYSDAIAEVAKQNPEWKFVFIGAVPWQLSSKMDAVFIPGMDIFSYMRFIRERAKAQIHIVPLADNIFNRSKSNIAWMEASSASSVCVVPDWDEWRKPGVIVYEENFERMLRFAVEEDTDREQLSQSSWRYIQSNLLLSQINQARLDILGQLLS